MNVDQVTALLARIQVLDNRQVDQLTIEAWTPLMSRLDYAEAVEAVNIHFQTSSEYLQPAHIVAGVKRLKGSAQPAPFSSLPRDNRIAPKPTNFDAMVAAYQSGDQRAVDKEVAMYDKQLGAVGLPPVHAVKVGA